MKVETFVFDYVLKRSINILQQGNSNLTRYKTLTEHFQFQCNITEKGCGYSGWEDKAMCCCGRCFEAIGYLKNIRSSLFTNKRQNKPEVKWQSKLEVLKIYAQCFNEKTGFWRKGKGCILPRRLRSITCLTYVCNDTCNKFIKKNGKDIQKFKFRCLLAGFYYLERKEKKELHALYLKIKEEVNQEPKKKAA